MISLSWKCSWQCMKHDIYKVVTCYHGSCVNDLSPETSEVPGIGHGQSTSANGDGLYVAKKNAKPAVFCWFWSTFWGGCFFHVSIEKNPQISTKKLDSSTGSSVRLFQSFHPLYSFQKVWLFCRFSVVSFSMPPTSVACIVAIDWSCCLPLNWIGLKA